MDYDLIAARYDTHRGWDSMVPLRLLAAAAGPEAVAERNDDAQPPRGPLLEIGCGTGNVTRWLVAHWPGPVLALDISRGMLAQARAKVNAARLLRADAARLPLRGGSISAALGSFVLHHLDAGARAMLFAELRRVLDRAERAERTPRAAFITSGHAQIRAHCLTQWFPTFAEIDCARFPDVPLLCGELAAAGFSEIGTEHVARPEPRGGRAFLEKVKARFVSTLDLLPEEEFTAGVAAMERQLERDGHLGDVSWQATIVHGTVAAKAGPDK